LEARLKVYVLESGSSVAFCVAGSKTRTYEDFAVTVFWPVKRKILAPVSFPEFLSSNFRLYWRAELDVRVVVREEVVCAGLWLSVKKLEG